MALQDLTPQLRTRLNRMERAVGWFVFFATTLLVFGFGYYIYQTAVDRGWFVIKAKFHTYVKSSEGLKVGDKVYMMGFDVGEITLVHPMPPRDKHDVKVEFEIRDPFFRYIWSQGSYVKITSANFLGRQLEVTRATNGYAICVTQPVTVFSNLVELAQQVEVNPGHWQLSQDVFDAASNLVFGAYTTLDSTNLAEIEALKPPCVYAYDNTVNRNHIVASWHPWTHRYENFSPADETAWLKAVETPQISDRLDAVAGQVQQALPNILALTNRVATILDNTAKATSNLDEAIWAAKPMLTNFAVISGTLREPGGLGVLALGTNGPGKINSVLGNVDTLLVDTDTNLNHLTDSVGVTLDHLAEMTSNLNAQVQSNSNILWTISKTVRDTDDFVQGLKHHWFLRSAFKHEKKDPPGK